MAGLTFEQLVQILWSFCLGLADSLRGAVDLFLLDSAVARKREHKMVQRDLKKEVLLNRGDRESPARESMETFAKKRALERRERAASAGYDAGTTGHRSKREREAASKSAPLEEPRILERTLKCCLLNGCVFWASIILFERVLLPTIQAAMYLVFGQSSDKADRLWTGYTQPVLSFTFSALWVLPFFLLSKIVNAIWFQDIADSAFRSSRGRPQMMSSISVMIADTVFSLFVESIFLVQAKICSYLPITVLGKHHVCNISICLYSNVMSLPGNFFNMVHLCLLFSLYSFEYKWFNQGLELHKRLTFVEHNWPYFLGFGFPLAVLTNMSDSLVVSGCVFSILFPLFIVSGNQAQVVTDSGAGPLHIFHPTIVISNAIFAKTFRKDKTVAVRAPQVPPRGSPTLSGGATTRKTTSKPTISFANSSVSNQSRL